MSFYYFFNFISLNFAGTFLQDVYRVLVYRPQLNLLYFLYNLAGQDFGIAVMIVAVIVNLITLPLFAKSFINMQKRKVLTPLIQEIQTKYKSDPQKMFKKMGEFNKKHGLNNSYTMLVLFVQIFFISGLFFLIRDVVNGTIDARLYSIFFGDRSVTFAENGDDILAFGRIPIDSPSGDYILIPIIVGLLSFVYGYYTSKLAPKPKLPEIKPKKKKKDKKEEEKVFDPEAMQKSMEFQMIYIMPLFLFAVQFSLSAGVSIYMATSSFLSLIRQIFLTHYYAGHTDKLLDSITTSDPQSRDDDPSNNLEITADPADIASQPKPTKVLKNDNKETKTKNLKQNKNKKKSKKHTNKK